MGGASSAGAGAAYGLGLGDGAANLVRWAAPEAVKDSCAIVARGLVAVPSVIVGAALGAAVEGTAEVLESAQTLRDDLASMAHKRKQTSEGVAQLPDEAAPLLLALVVGRHAQVITEAEAFDRAAAFSVRCALDKLSLEEVLEQAEVAGRDVLTYVKLRECYPNDEQQAVEEAAWLLARDDPEVCDAVWIACGQKPLAEWSSSIRNKALSQNSAGVTPQLLRRALQFKFEEVLPCLSQKLQRLCPGGSEKEYTSIILSFHQTLPAALFWNLWRLLQHDELPQELRGLTFEQLSYKFCAHEFKERGLRAKPTCPLADAGLPQDGKLEDTLTKCQLQHKCTANAAGQLRVEVLRAESLSDPEYRVGDMTSSLFGAVGICSRTWSPYVEISWGKEVHQTRVVEAKSDGSADFGESFPLQQLSTRAKLKRRGDVVIRCFDARTAQSALRGDPLFGEGALNFDEFEKISKSGDGMLAADGTQWVGEVVKVKLQRDDGQCHGKVAIRFIYQAPRSSQEAAEDKVERPLVLVVKTLARVLRSPGGVTMLVDSRPLPTRGTSNDSLLPMLEDWTSQFVKRIDELSLDATDEECAAPMASMGASVQMVVSACVPSNTSSLQVQGIAAAWIRGFFAAARAAVAQEHRFTDDELAHLNESRLLRMLQAGLKELEQPRTAGPLLSTMSGHTAPPRYWQNQTLKHGEQIGVRVEELDSAFFRKLMGSATHHCCSGRDGTFDVDRIKSVTVHRLENPITWRQYMNKGMELAARHEIAGVEKCPPIEPPVPTSMCPEAAECRSSMNEVYLWHATKHDTVDLIMKEGFDERVCSLHGLFGAGVYFAEESCKSGQYAKQHGGTHYFFLCRVLLGRPHYATRSMNQIRRAPEGCDSVIANIGSTIKLGHRELIVYDRFQAYPEFLVEASTYEIF